MNATTALRAGATQRINQAAKARCFAAGLLESRSNGKKLDILFDNYGAYLEKLKLAFRFSRHNIRFEDFTTENIAGCDLVIPLTMSALRFSDKHRHLLLSNPIPIPTKSVMDTCDDKFLFSKSLIDAGFSDYTPAIGRQLYFPYVLKRKVSWSSNHVFIIGDEDAEHQYSEQLESDDFYCQEMILGESEYATHILFKDNRIIKSLSFETQFEIDKPIKNQVNHSAHRICKCLYLDVFAEILRAVGFEGLCCFDYKVQDGRPKVLELNPRIGASLTQFALPFVTAAIQDHKL